MQTSLKQFQDFQRKLPFLSKDLQELEFALEHVAGLGISSPLNKIRFITEKVLSSLCEIKEVSWGQAEPTLERMKGPLVAKGHIPKAVAIHLDTIQRYASPGSHYQKEALSKSHLKIALDTLGAFLDWYWGFARQNGLVDPATDELVISLSDKGWGPGPTAKALPPGLGQPNPDDRLGQRDPIPLGDLSPPIIYSEPPITYAEPLTPIVCEVSAPENSAPALRRPFRTGSRRRSLGQILTAAAHAFIGALGHGIWGGLVGTLVGVFFAALCFWVAIAGSLYGNVPVNAEVVAQRRPFPLAVAAQQIQPPEGPKDQEYMKKCAGAVWGAVAHRDVALSLLYWFLAGFFFGVPASLCCQVLRALLSPVWGKFLESLAIILMFAGLVTIYVRPGTEEHVRLALYLMVLALNLVWMSLTGFRFRSLLYSLAVVLAGELRDEVFPLVVIPGTAFWYGFLFFFLHAGYGAFVLESRERQ
jgi:hypothetical protein